MLSWVGLLATPHTVAPQASLSMGFPRQEYWSGLTFPTQGGLPDPGIKPMSLELAGSFFTTEPPGKPLMPAWRNSGWFSWNPIWTPSPHQSLPLAGTNFRRLGCQAGYCEVPLRVWLPDVRPRTVVQQLAVGKPAPTQVSFSPGTNLLCVLWNQPSFMSVLLPAVAQADC